MQFEGFKFNDIYLETENDSFDLHNCYNFTGFSFNLPSRVLSLRWAPNGYAKRGETRRIRVEFHGVSQFSCDPQDSAMPFTEDDCVTTIYFDTILAEYCVFVFMSGFTIKVCSERVTWAVE
jgi:hypothetical protein